MSQSAIRKYAVAFPLVALACLPGAVCAQAPDYPSRQVTIIVPTGPGASTDVEARLYAQKLAERTLFAQGGTPTQLGEHLASDIRRWSDVIARAKIAKQ